MIRTEESKKSFKMSIFQTRDFQAFDTGELQWGDVPMPSYEYSAALTLLALSTAHCQSPRDFSALAGPKNRRGQAFASLDKHRQMAVEPELPFQPSVCPNCDGAFHCSCADAQWDMHSCCSHSSYENGCEDCGKNPCRCCDGCIPGCVWCTPGFNPTDPYDDGAPEEHWDDDEDLYWELLCR